MATHEPTLPVNRAFVVQFRVPEDRGQVLYAGRVEHMASAQATRFESWEDLQAFIERTLRQVSEDTK